MHLEIAFFFLLYLNLIFLLLFYSCRIFRFFCHLLLLCLIKFLLLFFFCAIICCWFLCSCLSFLRLRFLFLFYFSRIFCCCLICSLLCFLRFLFCILFFIPLIIFNLSIPIPILSIPLIPILPSPSIIFLLPVVIIIDRVKNLICAHILCVFYLFLFNLGSF